jgi:hypothetical protein
VAGHGTGGVRSLFRYNRHSLSQRKIFGGGSIHPMLGAAETRRPLLYLENPKPDINSTAVIEGHNGLPVVFDCRRIRTERRCGHRRFEMHLGVGASPKPTLAELEFTLLAYPAWINHPYGRSVFVVGGRLLPPSCGVLLPYGVARRLLQFASSKAARP